VLTAFPECAYLKSDLWLNQSQKVKCRFGDIPSSFLFVRSVNKATLKAVLGRNDWFAGLGGELADGILELGRIRRLNDSLIYSADDVADGVFAPISGQVRMTRVFNSGQPAYLLIASPGAWFGISAAMDGKPYGHDAAAIGGTVIFHLTRERMKTLIGGRVENYAAFANLLANYFRVAIDTLIAQRNRRPLQILAHELLRLAERHGRRGESGVRIDLRLSQEDLAVMIGVGRQTINRLLKTLEQDGAATLNYASITIQSLEALARIRGGEEWPGVQGRPRLGSE
jgi:CRP/FNR family cyclic AMP-dependent transcriptional regulator